MERFHLYADIENCIEYYAIKDEGQDPEDY